MKYVLPFLSLLIVVFACSKDKFESKPMLKLKSTSNKTIPYNGSLRIVFEYNDKEGDLADTLTLFFKKERMNQRTVSDRIKDTLSYSIPKGIPTINEGEILLTIPFDDLQSATSPLNIPGTSPPRLESDSLTLKFALRDKAKHVSDTVIITGVVVQRD